MSITERLMGIGAWNINLDQGTPRSILDQLDVRVSGFGHIVVTPTPVAVEAIPDAGMLALARYVGVYRKQPTDFSLSGGGTALWLNDEDGQGRTYINSLSTATGAFAEWVAALRPADLLAGITSTIAGVLAKTYNRTNLRIPLDDVCAYFGAEWRVTNKLEFDIGAPADLFNLTPTAVIVRNKGEGGRDLNIQGLVGDLALTRDVEDWQHRVIYYTGTEAAPVLSIADGGLADDDVPFRGPFGGSARRDRLVEGFSSPPGSGPGYAAAMFEKYRKARQELRLSTDLYDIGQDVRVGDNVFVYDPSRGIQDPNAQVEYRGRMIYPETIRCVGLTWPIRQGMGVYFRYYTKVGAAWELRWLDLTNYVRWEEGSTEVEVGEKPRKSRTK